MRAFLNRRLVIGMVAALIGAIVTGLILASSYSARSLIADNALAACARSVLDRAANAEGWRAAEGAREDTARISGNATAAGRSAQRAANTYRLIAEGLEERSRIDCRAQYQRPSLLP